MPTSDAGQAQDPSTGPDGASSVGDLLASPPAAGDEVTVRGYVHSSGGHVVACDHLAETWPPQPGGPQVVLVGTELAERGDTTREQDDVWTEAPVIVNGTWRDGAVHVDPPNRSDADAGHIAGSG